MPFYLVNTEQSKARVLGVATSEHPSIGIAVAHYRTLNDDARKRGLPAPNLAIVEATGVAMVGAEVPLTSITRRFSTDGTPC